MERTNEKPLVAKPKTVKNALVRIGHAALSSKVTLDSELESEFAILQEKCHLNEDSTIIVAILFVRMLVTEDILYSALRDHDCNDSYITCMLDGLKQRGMISSLHEPENCTSYRLTPRAKQCLLKGEPLQAETVTNCMKNLKELHSFSTALLREQKWLRAFREGFHLEGNDVFLHADESLGLSSLPENTQIAFWVLANHFIHHFSVAYNNYNNRTDIDEKDLSLLVKKGLVDIVSQRDVDEDERINYVLSVSSAKTLFHGMDEIIKYDQLTKFATIIPFSSIKPIDLFFSPLAAREIDALRKVLSSEGFERATRILESKKRNPAIQSLLWGAPGTGKTEVVRQLARETGRDLIIMDPARLFNSNWGDSEKAFRYFFKAYSYVTAVSSNAPILLLNEADSILSKRLATIDRSIDKAENAVTDILLQEFETMRGILLATTNFTNSIDDAFDRRFLFKTELGYPDESAREHIWKNKIPELTASEAHELACIYSLTGAQIHNIAVKRELAELYYEGERGLSYIRNLCEEELSLSKAKTYKKIGF